MDGIHQPLPVQEDTQAVRLKYQYIFNEYIYYILPIDKC